MEPGEMAGMMMMDLYIETLTGTAFELRVSPFETVLSVKNKIYRLEGIPVSQQHLIWNERELNDDLSLHECEIPNGSTLRLVLGMRGGPINTRRVPLDLPCDPAAGAANSLSDLFPYADGPTTFLVFRDGDQLNFFQVVDRGDGTLSPLAESLASFREDEDYEESEVGDLSATGAVGPGAGADGEEMQRRLRLVQLKLDQMRLNRRAAGLRHGSHGTLAARDSLLPPIADTRQSPPPPQPPLASRSASYDPALRPHPGAHPGPAPVPLSMLGQQQQRLYGRSGRLSSTMPAKRSTASGEAAGGGPLSRTQPLPGQAVVPAQSSSSSSAASRLCPELIQIGSSRLSRLVPASAAGMGSRASPLRHLSLAEPSPASGRREVLPPVEVKSSAMGEKSKRKKRCFQCHKKTGLVTSYQCRCGNNFCAKHRYAEVHGCPFDYKAEGRRLIQESNPVVAASKLPKI